LPDPMMIETPEIPLETTSSATASPKPSATLTPTPTATPEPVTFTVGEKDDMFSIALYYGIPLEALKTANPNVNPNAMGVGTVLQIPLTPTPRPTSDPSKPTSQATSETGPLKLTSKARCYPDALGGARCLVLLTNECEEGLENPAVGFRLKNPDGSNAAEMIVFAPLNLMPAGATLPVYAYFPTPVPEGVQIEAWVDSWLPTMPGDERYAAVTIDKQQIVYENDDRSAFVSGELSVATQGRQIASVWLLAVAYDADGNPLGLRRWEASLPISDPGRIPFETIVYSMAGPIAAVELFAEARLATP
jgi:LysM repeat protein